MQPTPEQAEPIGLLLPPAQPTQPQGRRVGDMVQSIERRLAGQPTTTATAPVPEPVAEMPTPVGEPEAAAPTETPTQRGPFGRPAGSRGRAVLEREEAVRRIAEEAALTASRTLTEAARQERENTVRRAEAPPEPELLDPEAHAVPGWEDFAEEDIHERFRQLVAEDPAIQLAGEEAEGLTIGVRTRMRTIPEDVKREVRRAHHALGHCGRDQLVRLARMANKSKEHIFYAKWFKCPICASRTAPGHIARASPVARPDTFNVMVAVDLKFVPDVVGNTHVFLNVLDIGTRFSQMIYIPNKASFTVAMNLIRHWFSWAGPPDHCVHDLGTEFSKHFTALIMRFGMTTRVAPVEAPWQNAMCERHGGVLAEIMSATCSSAQIEGAAEMELCGFAAASAKNRRPDRTGYSSRGRVFGREEKWPGAAVDQALDGEWPTETQGATGDGDKVFRRAMQIRLAAQDALVKMDSQAIWARALNSPPFPMQREWTPGAQVFVWRRQAAANRYGTGGGRGRRARMASRWYGPGCVLGREATSAGVSRAYWVAFNGTLFLVAPEHLRAASQEERLADAVMTQVAADMRGALEADRGSMPYVDLRQDDGGAQAGQVDPFDVAAGVPAPPVAVAGRARRGDLDEPDAEAGAPSPIRPRPVSGPVTPTAVRHGPSEEPVIMPMEQYEDGSQDEPDASDLPDDTGEEDIVCDEEPSRPDADEVNDALALINKVMRKGTKGKELDPKQFDDTEREAFNGADLDQWETHIRTGAIRIVPPKEARSIDPSRILRLPPRFVRTNKNEKNVLFELKAKSRLVVPGHVAPDGEVRTDAPVTPQQSLYISLSLSANHRWRIGSFDVKDAFLSGKKNPRKLFVRPPREGIRGVPQDALIELVKGVSGLRESPRLWWLQLREHILTSGFVESRFSPATFMIYDPKDGSFCGVLVVHVDDGLWAGAGAVFESARDKLRALITIGKEERSEFDFLGRHLKQGEDYTIRVDQDDYVKKIKPIYIPAARRATPEDSLTGVEISQYLSLVQQLAWPVRTTLVRHAYLVSDLQQKTSRATVADLVRANFVRRDLVKAVEDGEGLTFRPMKGYRPENMAIVAAHDASFSNEAGMKSQQGYMLFAAQTDAFSGEGEVHFLDWSSSTIKRVVRSTLAAESAAASKCFDRAVFLRVIIAEFLQGSKAIGARWQDLQQRVPMLFLSDCRSMVEHIQKTGAAVDEKRVAMDLADLRAGVDAGDLVVWIPTKRMVADCLTKHLTLDEEVESIKNLLRDGRMHLRFSDDGQERVLSAEQRKAEGANISQRETAARAVPAECDSEDEAFSNPRPRLEQALKWRGVVAFSKHIGVGLRTGKVHQTADATTHHATVAFSPRTLQRRSQRRF